MLLKQRIPDGMLSPIDEQNYPDSLLLEVDALLAKCATSGEVVSNVEAILDVLKNQKLCWSSQVAPCYVGVCHKNRAQFGVGFSESQHLGADILKQGWSWRKASSVTAVERPPKPFDQTDVDFNNRLVQLSDGLMPPLASLKLLSLGGGHTNTFLRQVSGQVRSVVESLKDSDDKLNKDLLSAWRPAFGEAVEKGLFWTILAWPTMFVWPQLPDVIQKSLNTEAKQEQSEVEVMLAMHEMYKGALESGKQPGDIDWQAIEQHATHSNPPCKGCTKVIASVVRNTLGGKEGVLLKELHEFVKTFGCSTSGPQRVAGSEYIGKVDAMSFGAGVRRPYVQMALIKAQLAAPARKVVDGACKVFTPANAPSLALKANKDAVDRAEMCMTESRTLLDTIPQLDAGQRVKLLGKLDCRLIMHLCKKTKEIERTDYKCIDDIMMVFINDLSSMTGAAIDWSGSSQTSQPPVDAQPMRSSGKVESLAEMTSESFQASTLGFKVGVFLTNKSASEAAVWRIDAINPGDDTAVLVKVESGVDTESTRVQLSELFAQWKVHKGKVCTTMPGYVPGSAACTPSGEIKSIPWHAHAVQAIFADAHKGSAAGETNQREVNRKR